MVFVRIRPISLFASHFNLTATLQPFTLYGLLTLQKGMVSWSVSHNEADERGTLYL